MKWKEVQDKSAGIEYSEEESLVSRFDLANDMLMGLASGSLGVVIVPKSPKAAMVTDVLTQYRDQLWAKMVEKANKT